MDEELYQQNILDHYKHPHNKGVLEVFDMKSQGSNPTCGDKIALYIKLSKNNAVEDVSFDGDGCAISISAVSMLTDHMKWKSLEELKLMTPGDIYDMLGVQIGPARVNCALLGYKALNEAIK